LFLAVLYLSLGSELPVHKCIHDEIAKTHEHHNVHHATLKHVAKKVSAANNTWASLRMVVDWSQFTNTDQFGVFIRGVVFPAALVRLQKAFFVHPVTGNLLLHQQCARYYVDPYKCIQYYAAVCGDIAISNQYLEEQGGTGIPNADYLVYVTALPTQGSTLAYAAACQFDSQGRPVAGYINFGPRDDDYKDPFVIEYWVTTALHEMFHALGFSSYVWQKYYKTPTGQPYSPIRNFTERGEAVNKLVSPNVLREGQKFMGCASLNGVELESSGGAGTVGSHIEQRTLNDDLMTGSLGASGYTALSTVDLAIMEDSGWYKVDYSQAGPNYWGKSQGCVFAYDKCINGSKADPQPINYRYYCKTKTIGCSLSRRERAICNLYLYEQSLPSQYQYFTDSNTGGFDELTDFCPYYVPFTGGSCYKPANQPEANYWGETYGPSSKCMPSTLEDQSFSRYYINQGSACYAIDCGSSAYAVGVNGVQKTCTNPGQVLTWQGFRGNITCVSWSEVCQ